MQKDDKIKELTRRIKDLESQLETKNQQIQDYQEIERIADEKIKGLNAFHSDKIRALMNSIQLLKKENASLSKDNKEHKRSELINNLNKEIADQDVVIETLRALLNDDKRADAAILEALKKGPPRIRVISREELKMEIKALKTKVSKLDNKKGGVNDPNDAKSQLSKNESVMSDFNLEEKVAAASAELIMKINDLQNDIEDLHLTLAGKDAEIQKYKDLISKKNQDLIELNQAKVENKFVLAKNEELQKEIESLRAKFNIDLFNKNDQELKIEQLEMFQATNKNVIAKNQETMKLELNNIQIKLEEFKNKNNDLLNQNQKLKQINDEMNKTLIEAREKRRLEAKMQNDEIDKLKKELREKENTLLAINKDLENHKKALNDHKQTINDHKQTIDTHLQTIDNQNKQIEGHLTQIKELENALMLEKLKPSKSLTINENKSKSGARSDAGMSNKSLTQNQLNDSQASSRSNVSNLQKSYLAGEISPEIERVITENNRLKEIIKELRKREVDLQDKIDILTQEKQFFENKLRATNLLTKKDYKVVYTEDELKTRIREITERYDTKIKQMTEQIKLLEVRNTDLEEYYALIKENNSMNVSQISLISQRSIVPSQKSGITPKSINSQQSGMSSKKLNQTQISKLTEESKMNEQLLAKNKPNLMKKKTNQLSATRALNTSARNSIDQISKISSISKLQGQTLSPKSDQNSDNQPYDESLRNSEVLSQVYKNDNDGNISKENKDFGTQQEENEEGAQQEDNNDDDIQYSEDHEDYNEDHNEGNEDHHQEGNEDND